MPNTSLTTIHAWRAPGSLCARLAALALGLSLAGCGAESGGDHQASSAPAAESQALEQQALALRRAEIDPALEQARAEALEAVAAMGERLDGFLKRAALRGERVLAKGAQIATETGRRLDQAFGGRKPVFVMEDEPLYLTLPARLYQLRKKSGVEPVRTEAIRTEAKRAEAPGTEVTKAEAGETATAEAEAFAPVLALAAVSPPAVLTETAALAAPTEPADAPAPAPARATPVLTLTRAPEIERERPREKPQKSPERAAVVYFDYGSATLDPAAGAALLEEIEAATGKRHRLSLVLSGHADTAGGEAANLRLSAARAAAVRAYLEGRLAMASVEVQARGEADPALPTGDGVREARNRRVEVLIR